MIDLSGLNREQLEAVLCTEGPVLVLAGAGSGKTRVITFRLARLVGQGVDPKAILCVTFTNKAAAEMRSRARELAGKSVRGATISTFHALGARLLKAHPEQVGLRPGFTISDGADQLGLLRRLLRTLHLDERRFDPKRVLALISQAKNAGLDAEAIRSGEGDLPGVEEEDEAYEIAAVEVYARYERALRAQNVVDFDDLLLLPLKLLRSHEDLRSRLSARWSHLMVDEYQDTNAAQFELLAQLAGPRPNLCVVGDDDQSIYGWRGADVRNILGFEQQFPGARRIMLVTNYRSTGHILAVANAIIEDNPGRYDKRLVPAGDEGEPVRVAEVENEEEEAQQLASRILALQSDGVPLRDIAILFRSAVQSRPVELALRSEGVPYKLVGGPDLFDRREIKDALAYLRILQNPDEEQALRRIANWPARGLGDGAMAKAEGLARDEQIGLFEALGRLDETGAAKRTVDSALGFVSLIVEHRRKLARQRPSTVAKKLLEAVGFEAALLAGDDLPAAERRIGHVRALVRQLERYEERSRGEDIEAADEDLAAAADPRSLEAFLSDLALAGFEDASRKDDGDRVVLSTIHAAKGLEWPTVFLIGWEEELLPHRRSIADDAHRRSIADDAHRRSIADDAHRRSVTDDAHRRSVADDALAEERRLAYVAVTRARRALTITHCRHRTRYGQWVPRKPSRFLAKLPEDSVERLTGAVRPPRTEEEERAIGVSWAARIRADLEARRQGRS